MIANQNQFSITHTAAAAGGRAKSNVPAAILLTLRIPFRRLVLRLLALATVGVAMALPAQIISGYYTNASGGYQVSLLMQPSGIISSLQFKASFSGWDNYQGTYYSSISRTFYGLPSDFSVTDGSQTGNHYKYLTLVGRRYSGYVAGTFAAHEHDRWPVYHAPDHTASGGVEGQWFANVLEVGPYATNVTARPVSPACTNFDVTVTFSKQVNGVDAGDLSISGTAVTAWSAVGSPPTPPTPAGNGCSPLPASPVMAC